MKKTIISFFIFNFLISVLSAFEWPVLEINKNSFQSYFGQKRGTQISSSIIFSDSQETVAVEKGRTIVVFEDEDCFFPSTLGASVIICHEDNLASVYANLDKNSVLEKDVYIQGESIGTVGNTGWQENRNTLEFQILDFKNKASINPMVLMPRNYEEPPVTISGIKLRNKSGTMYDISEIKYLAAGTYKVYSKKNDITVPFKTNILINGIVEDAVSFDSIVHENNKILISGKRKYPSEEVYPGNNMILLGEVTLTPGKCAMVISISNLKEVVKNNTYNISIY